MPAVGEPRWAFAVALLSGALDVFWTKNSRKASFPDIEKKISADLVRLA